MYATLPDEPLPSRENRIGTGTYTVVAQMEGEEVRVLDEIVLRRATTQQACEEFLKRYPNHGAGVVVYGDAAGNHEQTAGGSDYAR